MFLHVRHFSIEGVRYCVPHLPVAGTPSHQSTTADDSSRQFHDAMRACVRPDDGVGFDWFEAE